MKINTNRLSVLIAAIVLIISGFLLADKLLSTAPVQLVLEDGRVVPVEGVSYFSLSDVLFFVITAWLGGMSFLYIILYSKEKETQDVKKEVAEIQENKSIALLAADLLEGDEKILFQKIIENDGIMQRELVIRTGFSEPKVSRLLDRIERRGLIVRQRDGMGNRILLKKG